jgi:L-amino acid N-acyltransferase YncA
VVEIRALSSADLDRAHAFFQALPREDREYLKRDVYRREVVEQLIEEARSGRAKRLVAMADERIVAEGALELESDAWKKHVGELRLVVAHDYQRKGLGMLMARELYHLAAGAKLEELIVKMMRPQIAARKIFRKLGFHEETLLPEYVKDLNGHKQDLIVMRCDLEALWQELEDYFAQGDWQRAR